MIYCEIIIREKRVISPKSGFCVVDADDVFCIPSKCSSSKPLCGYNLPCGVPIQVYGVPKLIKGKNFFRVYFFAYIGTAKENARAAGISEDTIEAWGDRIGSDTFLCDLSVSRSDRLKSLTLEHPIDLINGFEQALSLEFSDQSDIYADKKRRQVLKASDYYCPREIVRPADLLERNPFLMAVPAVGFTYSECAQIATYLGNRAAFESHERICALIRHHLRLLEEKGALWVYITLICTKVYESARTEKHPIPLQDIKKALQSRTEKDMIWETNDGKWFATAATYTAFQAIKEKIKKSTPQQKNFTIPKSCTKEVQTTLEMLLNANLCIIQSHNQEKLAFLQKELQETFGQLGLKINQYNDDLYKFELEQAGVILAPHAETLSAVQLNQKIEQNRNAALILFVNPKKKDGIYMVYQQLLDMPEIPSISLDVENRFTIKEIEEAEENKAVKKQEVKKRPERPERIYIKYFKNATIADIWHWIRKRNVTIIDYSGRLFFGGEWDSSTYFPFFKLRYYNQKPPYAQGYYAFDSGSSFFKSSKKECEKKVLKYLIKENAVIIGEPIFRHYYIPGGIARTAEFVFLKLN